MTITHNKGGGVSFTGKGIDFFRLATMLHGLRLEVRTGMKLSRGISCYALAKKEFGLKGNKSKVLEQLENIVDEQKKLQNIVDEGE